MFKEYFLDANAHLPLNTKALKTYVEFHQSAAGHGHPSSPSVPGRAAALAMETARAKIASLIGADKPSNIFFTSNCTQACEWGLEIFLDIKPEPGMTLCSPLEHPAIGEAFQTLSEGMDDVAMFTEATDGVFKPPASDKICCIHTQNEIGVVQNFHTLKKNCRILFSDMSQSLGKIPVNVSELNVDIAVFGAHKFGGPGGLGFIYLKDPSNWHIFGMGSRYFLDRPGTPDVAAVVAAAVALEEAISTLEKRTQNMVAFQSTLEPGLEKLGCEIIGKKSVRSPNTTFLKASGKGLNSLFKLGEKGIHVGLGSACGSMHTGPSRIARTLKIDGDVHDFMRISQFGEYGEEDAKILLNVLEKVM